MLCSIGIQRSHRLSLSPHHPLLGSITEFSFRPPLIPRSSRNRPEELFGGPGIQVVHFGTTIVCTVRSSSIGFLSPMGDGAIWGPRRNCPQICGDCERGLDPAVVIPPEASSTPIISSESLAAAGYFSKTYTGKVRMADESPRALNCVHCSRSCACKPSQGGESSKRPPLCSVFLRMTTCRATSVLRD